MIFLAHLGLSVLAFWLGYYSGYRTGKKAGRTRVVMDGQDMGALNGTLKIERVHCDRCLDTGIIDTYQNGLRLAATCPCRKTTALPGAMNISFEV